MPFINPKGLPEKRKKKMNAMIRKAKAGVTLVELLVVILIVTILSVSLLPLLKPYIEESKYAAEPIPVLANIQTKINLYQYEKDKLPGQDSGSNNVTYVATWLAVTTNASGSVSYNPAKQPQGAIDADDNLGNFVHFASKIDVDWQDLLGRRMNPTHFKYAVLKGDGSSKYGYVLGVFGDGNGLGKGTGYAVMMIVDTVRQVKIVGTWKRYKPKDDNQVSFKVADSPNNGDRYCYIPTFQAAFGSADSSSAAGQVSTLLTQLAAAGWEFNEESVRGQTTTD